MIANFKHCLALPSHVVHATEVVARSAIHELNLDGLAEDVEMAFYPDREVGFLAETDAIARNPFKVLLFPRTGDWYQLLASTCHEIVHVEQMASGKLVRGEHAIVFDGKPYPYMLLNLGAYGDTELSVPWERDAYERMFPLLQKGYEQLPYDLRVRVKKSERQAVKNFSNPAWIKFYQPLVG